MVAALVFSSLMVIAMFFRLFEKAWFNDGGHGHHVTHNGHATVWLETSPRALAALVCLTISLLLAGIFNQKIMDYVVVPYLEMQGYL